MMMHAVENLSDHLIKAVAVNHNTSAYMELMARSLFARHPQDSGLCFSLHIFDNACRHELDILDTLILHEKYGPNKIGF